MRYQLIGFKSKRWGSRMDVYGDAAGKKKNSYIPERGILKENSYLTGKLRVKLHAKTDITRIGFQVQFNAEFRRASGNAFSLNRIIK